MLSGWQHQYDTVNTTTSVGFDDITSTDTGKTMASVSHIDDTWTDITSFATIVGRQWSHHDIH
jgi:hypothetical protein